MAPPEKTLLEGKLIMLDLYNQEKGLTVAVIYRDKAKCPWGKLISITSFIKDKEYELIKEGRIDYFGPAKGTATLTFANAGRGESSELVVNLAKLELAGTLTRGSKLADRAVSKISYGK